jgi:hypothetical protein
MWLYDGREGYYPRASRYLASCPALCVLSRPSPANSPTNTDKTEKSRKPRRDRQEVADRVGVSTKYEEGSTKEMVRRGKEIGKSTEKGAQREKRSCKSEYLSTSL